MTPDQRILDQALVLASESGWESLSLGDLAQALDLSLADIHRQFAQKDDLVEAWFNRADRALLAGYPLAHDPGLPAAERLERVMLGWLGQFTEYRHVTRQMLAYKVEPGHVHLQAAAVLRISRTVQWFREAAGLEARGIARIGQEVALSALFVATFVHWLFDESGHQQQTAQRLQAALMRGERIGLWR